MNRIQVVFPETVGTINPNLYGHFSEHIGGVIYGGLWVGEDSPVPNIRGFRRELVERFRAVRPPVLRWPGGCFAETYNWRDGIGPRESRPTTVNWWYRDDRKFETNQFGTHEFVDFCRLVGAEPYFAANLTTQPPLEIRNWMEYCNFPQGSTSLAKLRGQNGAAEPFGVRYWGLGNENWGGGGDMTPEFFCMMYRRLSAAVSSVSEGCRLIACGPNGDDADWTRRFFTALNDQCPGIRPAVGGFSAHYYCGAAGTAAEFTEDQWYELLAKALVMEKLVCRQRAALDSFDPERKIGLVVDEWGCWHPSGSGPSHGANLFEQQSTMRDALVTAMTLDIFNNNCDKVVMANAAQLVNNLHCLFLTEGEKLLVTPTYHVFRMMKDHQGARAMRVLAASPEKGGVPQVSGSASEKDGKVLITLVNSDYSSPADAEIELLGGKTDGPVRETVLAAFPQAHNTFEAPDAVAPAESTFRASGAKLQVTLPAASVVCLSFSD